MQLKQNPEKRSYTHKKRSYRANLGLRSAHATILLVLKLCFNETRLKYHPITAFFKNVAKKCGLKTRFL